jgi:hypothetical protein
MFMVFQSASFKLNPKMRIIWSWSPNCCFLCIDFGCALGTYIFLQCKTLHWKLSGHWSICHMPSSHMIFITSNPPWETIKYILCELHGNQWGKCSLNSQQLQSSNITRDKKEKEEDTMKSKWKNANNREPRLVTSRTKAKVNFLL